MKNKIFKVLSIAGSDSSGGAGIQADLKTMSALGVYGMTVITAVTAQNTTGVRDVHVLPPEMVREQMDAVFEDIPPDAVKIGMLADAATMQAVAGRCARYQAKNLVLDPVMVATSGARLMQEDAKEILTGSLFPMAALVTPNIPEAQCLLGSGETSPEILSRALYNRYGVPFLVKGGHSRQDASDVLYLQDRSIRFEAKRIDTGNTHGTGCTLSSAIACGLAKGMALEESIRYAKEYITKTIAYGLDLGAGSGPLYHMVK